MTMSPRQEAEAVLRLAGGDALRALEVFERQLNALHARAQVLLGLAGVVVTVTGFSGRLIAGTSRPAQVLIVCGLGAVLSSAVWLYARVMRVRWWLTGEMEDDAAAAFERIIGHRDAKTRAFARAGKVLCLGLALYGGAVAIMLLNPEPLAIPVR